MRSFLALGLVVLFASATQAQAVKVRESKPGLKAQATFSADSAEKIAMREVPKGKIREAELEEDKGKVVYSFDLKQPGKKGYEEVLVDAKTGSVVSKMHESASYEARERREMKASKKSSMKKPASK